MMHIVTNSVEQSPPSEAGSHSAGQEISRLLWNLKFQYRVHNSPQVRCFLSTPSLTISLRFILILSSHLRLGLPSGLFLTGFLTKILYSFIVSPVRSTFPSHLILFDLILLCFDLPNNI